ncbi:MAG TPA: GNAT family N-acetyltransferase [Spirochaetia bacterium]|nr:GNAT family N-acetyltransferase [Spirochaetia bacterium]
MDGKSISYAIRETVREDIAPILAISKSVGVFSEVEVATVDELLHDYFSQGPVASGYYFLTCLEGGRVVGFSCHGPRALTDGTYDLYWVASDPSAGRRGVGGALLARTKEEVRRAGGRLVIAETSGRAEYSKTRDFYEKHGYLAEAVIKDFYAPGDDIVMYVDRV